MSYIGKQPRKAALTSSDIEDGIITAAKIEDGAVVAAEIASNAVTTAKINADAVTAAKIADNAVVTAGINADAVTGAKIADDAINSEHYTNGSIDTAHIAADQIVGSLIADNAIDSEHYTDGSIDTAHIAADQITNAKIADDQIDSEHYVDGSIDTAHIANVNVTQAKIADQAINEAKMQISNAPTNGYMLTAQSGNTGGLTWAEAGGGGFTLLSTTSIGSAVGFVTIGSSSLFSSTYDQYIIRGNMRPASNGAHGYVRVRTSGGAQTSGYKFNRLWQYSGSGTVNTDSGTSAQFTSVLGQSTNDNSGTTFEIFLSKPNTTDNYKPISFRTVNMDSTPDFAHHVSGGAWTGATTALTGLDLYFSSGNIDTGGVITLHGVNKS